MPGRFSAEITIDAAGAKEVRAALEEFFPDLDETDRASRAEGVVAGHSGLLLARRRGSVVGAAFYQLQAGRTAIINMPRLAADEPPTSAARLVAEAVARTATEDSQMVYALLTRDEEGEAEPLLVNEFVRSAELLYLASLDDAFVDRERATPLTLSACGPEDEARLARIVAETYEGTLDCPALNGVREIGDILAGYRADGPMERNAWYIVRHGQSEVGCLLLADHCDYGNLELVYMGVVPPARGNGWGAEIVRRAQQIARARARERVVLAVDAANEPALRVYRMAGFEIWDRRICYLRIL